MNKEEVIKKVKDNALIIIMIFAFIIRFYYFSATINQPLWWDEAEYMSAGKSYAGIVDYQLSSQRLPGFPWFVSLFYRLGINSEMFLRFLINFIPALLVILLVYLTVNEMYGKKNAIISTLIITVLWEHLFYSNRFHTENLALLFQLLATFIFFRSYLKKQNSWIISPKFSLFAVVICAGISVLFRPGNIIAIPALLLFFILVNQSKIWEKISLILLIAIPLLIGIVYMANLPQSGLLNYLNLQNPIAWNSINIFQSFYPAFNLIPSVLFYCFIYGFLACLVGIILSYEKLKLQNDDSQLKFKSDIFCVLVIVTVVAFFMFIIRSSSYEVRWYFPLLIGMLPITSAGLIKIVSEIARLFKYPSQKGIYLAIFLLLSLGMYSQLYHADAIIKMKVDSYIPVKQAGEWLKENTNPGDIIISASVTQHTYYTERKVIEYYVDGGHNETLFHEKMEKIKPRYLVVSIFEPVFTPALAFQYPATHNDTWNPVIAFYIDNQVSLIIYERKINSSILP